MPRYLSLGSLIPLIEVWERNEGRHAECILQTCIDASVWHPEAYSNTKIVT